VPAGTVTTLPAPVQAHHGEIVGQVTSAVGDHLVDHQPRHLVGCQLPAATQQLIQPASAIARSALRGRLQHPVTHQHQPIPRLQRQPLHLVDRLGVHAKRQVGVQPDRLDLAAAHQPGQRMPGVDHRTGPPWHVKAQHLPGHKPLPAELGVQRPVGMVDLLQQPRPAAGVAQRSHRQPGQQCRLQAMAHRVGDRHRH
jgi:hypothetical protein